MGLSYIAPQTRVLKYWKQSSSLCIYMRMHVCVCTYIYAFFCSGSFLHFRIGFVGASACATVFVKQIFLCHQRTHLLHTRCRFCTYVYMHIYVYMHAYVYECVCMCMILFDALRCCCWEFLSVYRCACTCLCICVCMYTCICAWAYVCICIYLCLCICMHIHVHAHACGSTYALFTRILFIFTVQSHYMRVYNRCFFNNSMHAWWGIRSGVLQLVHG